MRMFILAIFFIVLGFIGGLYVTGWAIGFSCCFCYYCAMVMQHRYDEARVPPEGTSHWIQHDVVDPSAFWLTAILSNLAAWVGYFMHVKLHFQPLCLTSFILHHVVLY
jgi:hypothetical protein